MFVEARETELLWKRTTCTVRQHINGRQWIQGLSRHRVGSGNIPYRHDEHTASNGRPVLRVGLGDAPIGEHRQCCPQSERDHGAAEGEHEQREQVVPPEQCAAVAPSDQVTQWEKNDWA